MIVEAITQERDIEVCAGKPMNIKPGRRGPAASGNLEQEQNDAERRSSCSSVELHRPNPRPV